MRFLLDAAIAFLILGLVESLVKPLAKGLVEHQLRRVLPQVYAQLDTQMPGLLESATPEQMTAAIAQAIEVAKGVAATQAEIKRVAALYDPVAAAGKNIPAV